MICPHCNGNSYVMKTETFSDDNGLFLKTDVKKRRRVCKDCGKPFYTYEIYSVDYKKLKRKPRLNRKKLKTKDRGKNGDVSRE